MGSFNVNCFASNRTIVPGDKCLIVPLCQQSSYEPIELKINDEPSQHSHSFAHTSCYANAFWEMVGVMLEGEYYDYGFFNLSETASNKMQLLELFKFFHKNLYCTVEGENEYHDLGLDFKSLFSPLQSYTWEELLKIWEHVWAVGQEFRLFVQTNRGPRPVSFGCMHFKAVEYFNEYAKNMDFYSAASLDDKIEKEIKNKARFIFASLRTHLKYPDMARDASEFIDMAKFIGHAFSGSEAHMPLHELDYVYEQLFLYMKEYVGAADANSGISDECVVSIKQIIQPIIDQYAINLGLMGHNIRWQPSAYASQDYENEIGQAYAKFITAVNSD